MTMDEKKDLTQILNNYGPLRGNVERQIIVTQPGKEGGSESGSKDSEGTKATTVKVRASVLLELMKRADIGLDKRDRTKVCRLAALVLGCDYKSLYNAVSEGISLNARSHGGDVELANRYLDDLGADFRVKL
jgi:hypothetical protein